MIDIRGIHYETSEPVLNERDGYWYQRRRQVDGRGNLVGIGDQLIRLPIPGSKDGQYEPNLDPMKLGKLAGDAGQVGYGIIKHDPGAVARGAFGFTKDMQGGVHEDYKAWPGTNMAWEQDDIPAQRVGPYERPEVGARGNFAACPFRRFFGRPSWTTGRLAWCRRVELWALREFSKLPAKAFAIQIQKPPNQSFSDLAVSNISSRREIRQIVDPRT